MCFSVTTFIVFNKLLMNYPELTYLAIPGTSSIKHGSYTVWRGPVSYDELQSRRDSVPYAALYIAPILIDTRLHSTRGQFFIRHECGAMYTSQNEHFAYTYDIAVCIWIQSSPVCILQMNACRLCTRHVFESFQIHFLFCILEG